MENHRSEDNITIAWTQEQVSASAEQAKNGNNWARSGRLSRLI